MPTELIKQNNEEEDITKNANNKRRQPLLNNKYATDKYTHSLRRDLLLSNFDRTMIVEKARFEPTEEPITTQSAPAIPATQVNAPIIPTVHIPSDHVMNDSNELASLPPTVMTYALTMSPSAPTLSTSTSTGTQNGLSNGNTLMTTTPLTTSHSMNDRKRLTQVRSENNSSTNRKKHNNKKQTKPIMHGTASPAEVFHRNLVDAVSNVEDSDENEHYVYPFSGNESSNHHLSDMTTNGIHRPLSVRSTPVTLLHDPKRRNKGLGEWLKQTLYRNSQQQPIHSLDEEEEEWSGSEHTRRPKLRNNVKDHPSHQNSNKSSILSRWHDSFNKTVSSDNSPRKSKRTYTPTPIHKSTTAHYYGGGGNGGNNGNNNGGYTSDDEDAPLLMRRQKRAPRSKKNCKNICRNSILSILLVMVVLFLVIIYRAKPLMELTVDMGRVLATDKELIFDLKVRSENWNWWTIHVADADISVFAFSQIVPSNIIATNDVFNVTHVRGVDPAEYLGGLVHFDEPLSIRSSLFNEGPIEAISQIRIKSPGADTSGNERWSRMIRYPYGLVVRGVLKYRPIPLIMGMYPQSVAICNVTQVDPTTGTISTDPDKTICASQDEVNIFSRF